MTHGVLKKDPQRLPLAPREGARGSPTGRAMVVCGCPAQLLESRWPSGPAVLHWKEEGCMYHDSAS